MPSKGVCPHCGEETIGLVSRPNDRYYEKRYFQYCITCTIKYDRLAIWWDEDEDMEFR